MMGKVSVLFCSLLFMSSVLYGIDSCHHAEQQRSGLINKIIGTDLDQAILEKFQEKTNCSWDDVKVLEKELKRFFVIASVYDNVRSSMFSANVDELWHTFILFTKKYEHYCKEVIGKFIHHTPYTKKEKEARTPEQKKEAYKNFEEQYESIFYEKPDKNIWSPRRPHDGQHECSSDCEKCCGDDSNCDSCGGCD